MCTVCLLPKNNLNSLARSTTNLSLCVSCCSPFYSIHEKRHFKGYHIIQVSSSDHITESHRLVLCSEDSHITMCLNIAFKIQTFLGFILALNTITVNGSRKTEGKKVLFHNFLRSLVSSKAQRSASSKIGGQHPLSKGITVR